MDSYGSKTDVQVTQAAQGPIFIGGQHRSGTTLMRRLINRHSHIACGPESNLFRDNELPRIYHYLRTDWAAGLDPRYGFDPAHVDRVLVSLIDAVLRPYAQARQKRRWAEKSPKNILLIDTLFALFPTAQFIHVIRDPRDVYCSIRAKAARRTPRWATTTPALLATEWCRRIDYGLSWRAHPECYHEVRYEALVAEPEATMRSVLAFLREPWSPSVVSPGDEDVFTTSVGRWQHELCADTVRAIEAIAGETMTHLGYTPATATAVV